jgi:hypothetical protein
VRDFEPINLKPSLALESRPFLLSNMFNAPRPAQRYAGTSTTTGFGGSFVDENPLSSSVYDDGLDPWSAAPSPAPTPMPQASSSIFSSVIGMLKIS